VAPYRLVGRYTVFGVACASIFRIYSSLKMEATGLSKCFYLVYKATDSHTQEDGNLYIHCSENFRTELIPLLNHFFLEVLRKIVSPSMHMRETVTVPSLFTFNEELKVDACIVSPCEGA
jgi:hypothetical protein